MARFAPGRAVVACGSGPAAVIVPDMADQVLGWRTATPADLDWVLALEAAPENADFVTQWSRERHAGIMRGPGSAHRILEAGPAGERVGYVILDGIGGTDRSIELVRIVIDRKGRGHGRAALRLVADYAFEELRAHRLWLDVFEHNLRARRLYEAEGFRVEGELREASLRDGRFVTRIVLSKLEHEYRRGKRHASAPGPSGLAVVPMEPDHWEAVRSIWIDGMATGEATFETESGDWAAWNAAHLADCRLCAVRSGEVVGWAALSPVSSRVVYRGVAEVSVYVSAGARGRGVGRALLERLVTGSESAGIWMLQASVFPENLATLRLHASAGFRVVGRRERIGRHRGRWRDTLLLERRSRSAGTG